MEKEGEFENGLADLGKALLAVATLVYFTRTRLKWVRGWREKYTLRNYLSYKWTVAKHDLKALTKQILGDIDEGSIREEPVD